MVVAMLIDQGIYGIPEAAILAGVNVRTALRWFTSRTSKGGTKHVLKASLANREGHHAISFLDLTDLYVVGRLRELGVSFHTIRRAYEALRDRFGSDHPFSSRQLSTDGTAVFIRELADVCRDDSAGYRAGAGKRAPRAKRVSLENPVTRQRLFSTLDPYLDRLHFEGGASHATRWHIQKGIVIDPRRSFGKPVVEDCSVPTYILAAAFHANERDADLVARLYHCSPDAVRRADRFERTVKLRKTA
jgi:uncharacterized protein (DUF433 family)